MVDDLFRLGARLTCTSLSNWAGFREAQHIQLAEKVPRRPDKHNFSPSGMTFFQSIAIICNAKIKRLAHFCSETTSVCIESTLDVYQNRLPFVSKRLCVEMSVNLPSPSQTALHI